MQSIDNSSIISSNKNVSTHQILELFQNKKWYLMNELISKDPSLLMMRDTAGIYLIAKILLSQGSDALIMLQEFAIDHYLSDRLYIDKKDKNYNDQNDPYIQTFLKYKDSTKPNNPLKLFNDKIMYGDFDYVSFISQSPAFKFICVLGENNLISALKNKFRQQDNSLPDALKSLTLNAINSLLYSNDKKSDLKSGKILRQTTILLNDMIKHCTAKPVVQMTIKNDVDKEYIDIEFDQNIIVKSSLELSFMDGNIQINSFNKNNNYYDLIDAYNNTVLTIGKQFSWYKGEVQVVDPALNIKFSLWNLGHPDNNSEDIDESQKNLHQAFNDLFNQNSQHQFFDDLTDATSDLWLDIYNLKYERGYALLQYLFPEKQPKKSFLESWSAVPKQLFFGQNKTLSTLLAQKLPEDSGYMKKCFILRFIRNSILRNDLDGMIKWIEYAEKASDIIEHSLAIAVGALNIDAADKILDAYPRAIIENNNEYSLNLFTVLYNHSQSQLMNEKSYKNAVNAVAVKLLEYGYPISLIESAEGSELNNKATDFIQDLLKSQVQYSIKTSAINWISNNLQHIPFINVITRFGADVLKADVGMKFYTDIYSRSHDFIQDRLAVKNDNKIDISKFCYIFAPKLQQINKENFIKKLENITFIKNIKTDSFDRKSLVSAAYALSRISPYNFDKQLNAFNLSIPQAITSEEIAKHISNKEINSTVSKNDLDKNFLLYRLNQYPPIQIDSHSQKSNVCECITNGLATIGAGAITGGVFIVNEGSKKNNISMLLTGCSIMSLLYSTSNNSRVLYTILSIAISYYILQKLYQNNVDLRNYIPQQLKAPGFQKLYNVSIENTIQKISNEKIYNLIKNFFSAIYNDEFITQENFFKLIKDNRINSHKLSNAIDILKNNPKYNEVEAINNIIAALNLSIEEINMKSQGKKLQVLSYNDDVKYKLSLDFFSNRLNINISEEHKSKNDICKGIEDVVSDTHTQMITDQRQCSSQKSIYIS